VDQKRITIKDEANGDEHPSPPLSGLGQDVCPKARLLHGLYHLLYGHRRGLIRHHRLPLLKLYICLMDTL
jgi:hypothetical protein